MGTKMQYKISSRVSGRIYQGLMEICTRLECSLSYLLRAEYEAILKREGKNDE